MHVRTTYSHQVCPDELIYDLEGAVVRFVVVMYLATRAARRICGSWR